MSRRWWLANGFAGPRWFPKHFDPPFDVSLSLITPFKPISTSLLVVNVEPSYGTRECGVGKVAVAFRNMKIMSSAKGLDGSNHDS